MEWSLEGEKSKLHKEKVKTGAHFATNLCNFTRAAQAMRG